MPMACWLKLEDTGGGNVDISVNASPIQAAGFFVSVSGVAAMAQS